MKKVHLFVVVVVVFSIASCNSVTTEELLKKYEMYEKVDNSANKAGITIKVEDANSIVNVIIRYSNLKLNKSRENIELLADRYFIANATTPNKSLPILESEIIVVREGNNPTNSYYYSITIEKLKSLQGKIYLTN